MLLKILNSIKEAGVKKDWLVHWASNCSRLRSGTCWLAEGPAIVCPFSIFSNENLSTASSWTHGIATWDLSDSNDAQSAITTGKRTIWSNSIELYGIPMLVDRADLNRIHWEIRPDCVYQPLTTKTEVVIFIAADRLKSWEVRSDGSVHSCVSDQGIFIQQRRIRRQCDPGVAPSSSL